MGLLKLSLDECIDRFCNAARDVFREETGLVGFATRLVRLFNKGAIYRSAPFRRVLRDLCGDMPVRSIGNESVPEVVRVVIVATDQTSNLVLLRSYDRVSYLNKHTNESENVGDSFKLADA